jgi:Flp pilus assembly protein protease CpaA
MMPGHIFGATGAGDVKLLAAAGALLGPKDTIYAFLYTAIAGGVLALVVAVARRRLSQTLESTSRLVSGSERRAPRSKARRRTTVCLCPRDRDRRRAGRAQLVTE